MAERGTARLMPAVPIELRRFAACAGRERRGRTTLATALVIEPARSTVDIAAHHPRT